MTDVCKVSLRPVRFVFLTLAALTLLFGRSAAARSKGIVADCESCHGNGTESMVTLVASPSVFNPGDVVTMTLSVRSSTIKVGGAYVTAGGSGTLGVISGEGLVVNGIDGLTHNAPKAAVSGQVTFRFTWKAPATPGGVEIDAFVVAGNGNNAPSGDAPGSAMYQAVFGCEQREFFRDWDADGHGSRANGVRLGCPGMPPMGYAVNDGDCDENNEKVFPGATEICNGKDDNCNGQIDENAPSVTLWPDTDGDGYYSTATGTSIVGCVGRTGYAALGGDCAPSDPAIHPGVQEICNNKDDNCDGRIDEWVRPRCGTGWCTRESLTCSPADCTPSAPRPEECNGLDDDCDGEVDNDATCDPGMRCMAGTCVREGGATGSGGATATGGSSSGGATATGGSASGGAHATGGSNGTGGNGSNANGPTSIGCGVVGRGADLATSLLLAIIALAFVRARRVDPDA